MQNQSTLHPLRTARTRADSYAVRSIAIAVLVLLLGMVESALGQSSARAGDSLQVTLAEARARALQANPELTAVRLDTAISRGELRQARVLRFNPAADVLTAAGGIGTEAALSQELEVFGQRSARISASTAGIERSRWRVRDATRRVIGETDRSFYRLAAAFRRRSLADEVLALNERLASVATRQLVAGEISRLDYNLTVIEHGRSRSRALAARREMREVTIELARLIGLPDSVNIVPVLDATQHMQPAQPRTDSSRIADLTLLRLPRDSILNQAFALRPDLAEHEAALRQTEAEVTLARREALPNVVLRAATEIGDAGERVFRPGAALALPLFNRNQGEIEARQAMRQQSNLELTALRTQVRAEVARAISTYESASAEVEILEQTVLAPARQNRELVEIAYREGEVGLPVLLLIRNQAIDAELEYWEAWLKERETRATLDEVIGVNLPPQSSSGDRR